MSDKPRVLMLIVELGYGGAERSFVRLANYLSEQMHVTPVQFSEVKKSSYQSAASEELNVPLVTLDAGGESPKWRKWFTRRQKLRRLKKEHDVCISFLTGPNLLNVLAGCSSKTIISLRGSFLHDANAINHNYWLYKNVLLPFIYKRAARVVAVNEGIARFEVRQLCGKDMSHKTHVITPFVDYDAMIARSHEAVAAPYDTLAGQPLIAAVSRLSIEKNMHHLVPIFAQVVREVPNAKLLLVGSGPMEDMIKQQCADQGIAINNFSVGVASVIFAGFQPNPACFVRMAKVLAFPSGAEGLPNVLLEALAAQALIIAADAAWGVRSVIAPELPMLEEPFPCTQRQMASHGILMPKADMPEYQAHWAQALIAALKDAVWYSHYHEKAHQRLRDFDLQKVAPKWKALVERHVEVMR